MIPATEPMAATMLMSQQKALRVCRAHHLGENVLMPFCTMCIWICTAHYKIFIKLAEG